MEDALLASSEEIKNGIFDRILNFFRKRSLWLLHYCTGCGAVELPPTMTSRFDIERFGMWPMATPRQSDLFIITGYVGVKTLKRIIYTYEQMPEPKWVVGFGSCTINGGIYHESYATIKELDKYIPVDMFISGCMPRPQAIIDAFLKLMDMIQKGEANNYLKYKTHYEWFKKNQDAVLERTTPVLSQEKTKAEIEPEKPEIKKVIV